MLTLPANEPFCLGVAIYMNIPLEWFEKLKKTFILAHGDPLNLNFSEKFDFLGVFCEKLSKKENHPNLYRLVVVMAKQMYSYFTMFLF